ncbi:MAG TPA: hypothetical protein VGH16_07415 [Candidatus Binatia bacterium]|jgi:hypothetical protein
MNVPAAPEELIDSVRRRLAAQTLWRSALFFIPPLLAAWYIVFFLYRFAWLGPDAVMIAGAAMLIAAAALTAARFRGREPSRLAAARLADEKSRGNERFVTLATIGDAGPAEFISRLRMEAAALAQRIDFRRDFPFHGERSILNSLVAALAAVILFQLVFEWLPASNRAGPGDQVAAAAKRLAQEPRFRGIAADISAAAQQLQRRSLSAEDKQAIVDDALKKLEDRIAVEQEQGADIAGLQDAAEAIKNAMRETRTPLSLPWLTQGDGTGSGGGEGTGSAGQKLDKRGGYGPGERKEEKAAAKALDRSQQKKREPQFAAQGEKTSERPDHLIKDGSQEKPGAANEGSKAAEEKKHGGEGGEMKYPTGAKNQTGDGAKQSGRSGKESPGAPGEKVSGKLNEKDLRYVIVQLPEETGGNASGGSEAQAKKLPNALPSANVPLARPDDPRAAAEKQMLPLEYRGLIR